MPGDRNPENRRDLFLSPTSLAAGLFEEAYREIGRMQRYALMGGDSRDGHCSGSPFLGILGRMLGSLHEQTNYPHRQRLEELLARLQRQQGPQDEA